MMHLRVQGKGREEKDFGRKKLYLGVFYGEGRGIREFLLALKSSSTPIL